MEEQQCSSWAEGNVCHLVLEVTLSSWRHQSEEVTQQTQVPCTIWDAQHHLGYLRISEISAWGWPALQNQLQDSTNRLWKKSLLSSEIAPAVLEPLERSSSSLGFPGDMEDLRVIGRVAKDKAKKANYRAQWMKRWSLQSGNWKTGHVLGTVHLLLACIMRDYGQSPLGQMH